MLARPCRTCYQACRDSFNKIARDEMEIELFFADQLVPTGVIRAMQRTIDAVQSDDDPMASPTEVTVFGGYFPSPRVIHWTCLFYLTNMG